MGMWFAGRRRSDETSCSIKIMSAINTNSDVLGSNWHTLYSSIPKMLEAQQFRSYKFTPEAEYHKLLSENLSKGRQIYIDEILYRAHFSAFAALARTHTLCEAIHAAEKSGNYFGVCAALRGLLESSADINHSLTPVTKTLASYLRLILKLYHSGNEMKVLPTGLRPIEDILIHFMCARKLSGDEKQMFPKTHWAEQIATYIAGVERGEVEELYSRLCGISHPAADTVVFFEKYDHLNGTLAFSWKSEHSEEIKRIANEFRGAIDFISAIGYNTPLLLLGVLNEFHMPKVGTQSVCEFPLDWIPAWKELKYSIQQSDSATAEVTPNNVVSFPQK